MHSVVHLVAEGSAAWRGCSGTTSSGAEQVRARLDLLASLELRRLPITSELMRAAWALRANVAARDALYVAAAPALGAQLLTTDERVTRAVPDVVDELT